MSADKRGQHKPGTIAAWLWRHAEGAPTWGERRDALLARLAADRRWRWNGGRRYARRYQCQRDLLRAIAEGLVRITPRSGTAKFVELTDAGRAMLPQPAPPAPEPWAKRRAGISEFKDANP